MNKGHKNLQRNAIYMTFDHHHVTATAMVQAKNLPTIYRNIIPQRNLNKYKI